MTNSDPTNRHTFDPSTSSSSRRSKVLPIALVGLLAAGAVGAGIWVSQRNTNDVAATGDSVPELPPSTTPSSPVETVPPPTTTAPASSSVELRVRSGGGFTMWGNDMRSASQLAIVDNRLFVPGAMTEQFPQDALVPVLTRTLTSAELTEVAKAARDAGLENDAVDYGDPDVTDMPTTDITYTTNGKTYRHSIYALGFDTQPGTLTDAQTQNRTRINTFLNNLVLNDQATSPYTGDLMGWTASKIQPDAIAGQDPAPGQLAWPLPSLLKGDMVGCMVSEGEDGQKILEAFRVAKQNTVWTTPDGSLWQAAARVLLPGEPPCEPSGPTPVPLTLPPVATEDTAPATPGVSPASPPAS